MLLSFFIWDYIFLCYLFWLSLYLFIQLSDKILKQLYLIDFLFLNFYLNINLNINLLRFTDWCCDTEYRKLHSAMKQPNSIFKLITVAV